MTIRAQGRARTNCAVIPALKGDAVALLPVSGRSGRGLFLGQRAGTCHRRPRRSRSRWRELRNLQWSLRTCSLSKQVCTWPTKSSGQEEYREAAIDGAEPQDLQSSQRTRIWAVSSLSRAQTCSPDPASPAAQFRSFDLIQRSYDLRSPALKEACASRAVAFPPPAKACPSSPLLRIPNDGSSLKNQRKRSEGHGGPEGRHHSGRFGGRLRTLFAFISTCLHAIFAFQ
jgi:hypothetical protein